MTILELRKKYGLNQSELARRLGVSSTHISKVEGGKRRVTVFLSDSITEQFAERVPPGLSRVDRYEELLEAWVAAWEFMEKYSLLEPSPVKYWLSLLEQTREALDG